MFTFLFKECQIWNFPSWDHVFAIEVKKTAWLLMSPLRAVCQCSQWCFLPLLSALFPVFTFFLYSAEWRLVHLPSLKQSYENLFVFPANNPFTIGCNFHTRPGFQSSVLELWLLIWPVNRCSCGILDSTFIGFCPIDCQVSILRKHHHNVLPLNSHTSFFFSTGQFHLTGDWFSTCDLMIASVEEDGEGGSDIGQKVI